MFNHNDNQDSIAQPTDSTQVAPDSSTTNTTNGPQDSFLSLSGEPSQPHGQASGSPTGADTDGLLSIKQQALSELAPLVSHLDQSPEEKFRTTMMMIQASDNHTLIKDAYRAAQSITDEKAKAQALLDIVNEINYFTQQSD